MIVVTLKAWSSLCLSINHVNCCNPTHTMLLKFKHNGLIHLRGCHNSAGVVKFASVSFLDNPY